MSHPSSRARLALAIASVLCTSPAVFAIDRMWDEPAGGAFEVPTNWNPEGAPEPTDVVVFDAHGNGYTVTFDADATTAGLRVLADTLTFNLGGHTYNAGADFLLAPGQNFDSHLTVAHGAFQSQGTNVIAGGAGSAASLTLTDRASFASQSGSLRVGQTGTGIVTIRNNSDALLSSLVVGGGVSSGTQNTASGAVDVVGLGSMLTVTGPTTIGEWGNASVSVLDGGHLTTAAAMLATQASGRASVLLNGPGSTWHANGPIQVMTGSGSITALDGARIQSNGARLGGASTVLLSGTNTVWNSLASPFEIGQMGNASFTIADGAALSLTTASIGSSISSSTSPMPSTVVRVTGNGSTLKSTQTLNFHMSGRTDLVVDDGGTLTAMGLNYGTSPGQVTANISIDGTGSTVALTQSLLLNRVNVNITNGGTLATAGANIATIVSDSAVNVRISGHGSNWTTPLGQFQVSQGNGGSAEVHLEDGGQLTVASLSVGGSSTLPGLISVSGEGSLLSVTQSQSFMLGTQTNVGAELRVKDGGRVTSRAPIRINPVSRLVVDGGDVSTVNGPPIENGGLILHSGGTISTGTFTNTGELHLRSPEAIVTASQFRNDRLVHGTGRIMGPLNNGPTGEVRASGADRLVFPAQLASSGHSNAGQINLMNGGTIEFGAPLLNNPTGIIAFSGGGSLHVTGAPVGAPGNAVTNFGKLLFSGGSSDFVGTLANGGTTAKVIVTGNGTATFHGPVAHNDGEFRVSDGSTAVFLAPVTSGQGQFTGGGAKFFEGGQSQLGALTSGGDTTVQAPAGVKVSRFAEDALTVRGTFAVQPAETPTTNSLNLLTIIGDGVVDLANSDLLIDTNATTQDAVTAQVKQYIASARNAAAGEWQGPGLTSSAAAGDALKTLALIASGDDVLVRYTYDGDANGDGKVNADDYFKIDSGFLAGSSNPAFSDGDFNYDNRINADDYFLIDSAFLGQGEAVAAGGVAAIAAVPEPGAIGLLALCGWVAIRRRR